jgi:hypothetical protein
MCQNVKNRSEGAGPNVMGLRGEICGRKMPTERRAQNSRATVAATKATAKAG